MTPTFIPWQMWSQLIVVVPLKVALHCCLSRGKVYTAKWVQLKNNDLFNFLILLPRFRSYLCTVTHRGEIHIPCKISGISIIPNSETVLPFTTWFNTHTILRIQVTYIKFIFLTYYQNITGFYCVTYFYTTRVWV